MQNSDHGFGSYERACAGPALELLIPAELVDRCMVEYSYPECTTAVLSSLCLFRTHFPSYRDADVRRTMEGAADFMRRVHRVDGSWYGSWAVCFTYGTFLRWRRWRPWARRGTGSNA